jgi:hypothetical protein
LAFTLEKKDPNVFFPAVSSQFHQHLDSPPHGKKEARTFSKFIKLFTNLSHGIITLPRLSLWPLLIRDTGTLETWIAWLPSGVSGLPSGLLLLLVFEDQSPRQLFIQFGLGLRTMYR